MVLPKFVYIHDNFLKITSLLFISGLCFFFSIKFGIKWCIYIKCQNLEKIIFITIALWCIGIWSSVFNKRGSFWFDTHSISIKYLFQLDCTRSFTFWLEFEKFTNFYLISSSTTVQQSTFSSILLNKDIKKLLTFPTSTFILNPVKLVVNNH